LIALEGNFAYSFILGVMAAVNPCGFVLLPTYLIYYLGMEISREEQNAVATLRRGLTVGSSVSSGFIALFIVVGVISRAFTTVITRNTQH
jgi:cytochrome c biogenesis protein CcdA